MITADFHTHTSFSTDSDASPESMIETAIARGIKTYCITDHMDYLFPIKEEPFVFDPEEYFTRLSALKKAYRGQIDLRIGVELGLRDEPDVRDEVKLLCDRLTADYPFDFVIGSTHVIDHFDPYHKDKWKGRTVDEIVTMYFESILYSVRNYDCFHVYGHLDYILRYVPAGASIDMSRYGEIIDTILKELIARGKGIEINASWLIKGGPSANPGRGILKRYRELGGTVLTIGSDAHIPERIAGRFDEIEAELKELGYREYSVFKKGKESRRKL